MPDAILAVLLGWPAGEKVILDAKPFIECGYGVFAEIVAFASDLFGPTAPRVPIEWEVAVWLLWFRVF